jgi:hypothetical protein
MNKEGKDLIMCVNILNRVESMLEVETRIQISNDKLKSIEEYLTKAMKHINPSNKLFSSQLMIFGNTIESIYSLLQDGNLYALNNDTKQYLVDKLYPAIIEFKVNVGKFLTYNEFEYTPSMDSILKDIIDLCIQNKYYFEY